MGYELYRAVLRWAPSSLTKGEKLAALVLADDANDETRITWHSVSDPEILRQAMVPDDRAMRRIISRLKDEKVLEHVGGGHNGSAAKYRFLPLISVGSSAAKQGENDPATDPKQGGNRPATREVAGRKAPSNSGEAEAKQGEKHPASGGVAGRFSASSRVKTTLPTPTTPSTTSPTADKSAASGSKSRTEAKPTKHAVADELTAAFWKIHGKGLAQSFIAVRGVVRTAIGNGVRRDDLAHALDRVTRDGKPISGGTLAFALGNARARPRGSVLDPIPEWTPTTEVNL